MNFKQLLAGAVLGLGVTTAFAQKSVKQDREAIKDMCGCFEITFKYNETKGFAEVLLNSINVEHQIRTLKVSNFVSPIATVSEVRKKLVSQQQRLGKDKGVVMDGRDIGTVVFPDADLKLFMTASAEERAQRRYKELIERGDAVNYEDIYNNVVERDLIDTTRKDSPLVKAKDAIEIDNSQLTLDGQFHTILQLVKDKLAGRS